MISRSRDSTVCVVTRLWAGQPMNCGLIPSRSKKLFSSAEHPSTFGPHPASCFVGTGGAVSSAVKQMGYLSPYIYMGYLSPYI